jgi:hypothetical protein
LNLQQLSAMNMEPSILKKYLLILLRADDEVYYEKFEHFFDEALQHVSFEHFFIILTVFFMSLSYSSIAKYLFF